MARYLQEVWPTHRNCSRSTSGCSVCTSCLSPFALPKPSSANSTSDPEVTRNRGDETGNTADETQSPESAKPLSLWDLSSNTEDPNPSHSSTQDNPEITPTQVHPTAKSGSHEKKNDHDPKAPIMDVFAFKNILGFDKENKVIYLDLPCQIKECLNNMNIVH